MRVIEQRILRGPNVYDVRQAFMAMVELGAEEAEGGAALFERLAPHVPGLEPPTGPTHAHLLAAAFVALQRAAGTGVAFHEVRPVAGRPAQFAIVAGYELEKVASAAFQDAKAIVEAVARGETPDAADRLADLTDLVERYAPGPTTGAIVDAARRRDIPVFRVTEDFSLYQLGWGKHAKRIQASVTSNTSYIATSIAQDKDLTKRVLDEAGLPVPRGEIARSADEAVAAARRLRGPVALKPFDGNQGKGVSLDLREPDAIRAAYERARPWGRSVLVEQFVPGRDYRVLVVGEQVIAAAVRKPAQVVGDGAATIEALVAKENENPMRGTGHTKPLTRLVLDDAALAVLAHQGLAPADVPAAGRVVVLRDNANLSTGGTAEDVTDAIHPSVARACVRAAQLVGLDVAGIDLVCEDLARPLEDQHGAIIEVNAAPGIRMHQHPSKGQPHDVGAAIVASLFPPGTPARVPLLAITGTNGKTTTTLLTAHVLQAAGVVVGATTTEAIYVDGRPIKAGDCTGYWSARTVLTDPTVEAAVLEVARGGMFKRGLAFDACDVGVVLNVQDDHLGQHGAETLEDLAYVKGLLVRVARKAVVLNAEDPRVVALAPTRPAGTEVLYFSLDHADPVVARHLDEGGRAVYLRRNMIMLADGDHHIPLVEVDRVPFTLQGRARFNVANALASVAALWAAGYPTSVIASGLQTFTSGVDQNPGRMNFFQVRDFQVIADYAHNPESYRLLLETARALPHHRLIGVIAAPGDRMDDKLREIGRVCAGYDHLIIREMAGDLRGRKPGETPRLLEEGAREAGLPADRLEVIVDEPAAVERALAMATAGDLVVVGCADTPRLLAQLGRHAGGLGGPSPNVSITLADPAAEGQRT